MSVTHITLTKEEFEAVKGLLIGCDVAVIRPTVNSVRFVRGNIKQALEILAKHEGGGDGQ